MILALPQLINPEKSGIVAFAAQAPRTLRKHGAADAHDAGRPGLTRANKVQLMLMMLAAPAFPVQTKCS